METSVDVILEVYDLDVLHTCLERIQKLFNVRSEIVSEDPSLGCSDPSIQGLQARLQHGSARNIRLKLWTDTNIPGALRASKVSKFNRWNRLVVFRTSHCVRKETSTERLSGLSTVENCPSLHSFSLCVGTASLQPIIGTFPYPFSTPSCSFGQILQ